MLSKLLLCASALFTGVSASAEPKTIVDVVVGRNDTSTLVALAEAANVVGLLSAATPKKTLFAPTDAAFKALPAKIVKYLESNTTALTQVLAYHVLAAEVLSTQLKNGEKAQTLEGEDITVTLKDGMAYINKAQVLVADLKAENGVVHVIDGVLVPKDLSLPKL